MSFDLKITSNISQIQKQLHQFQTKSIPTAISKAEQRTVEAAQFKARTSMKRDLHKPTSGAVSAVRRRYRSKNQIKANQGSSSVYIADYLVDELWYNTITEIGNPPKLQTKAPESGKRIVIPTKRQRNAAGNLKGFRGGKLKKLRESKKYFEIKVGAKVKGQFGYLKPGIYEIMQRGRQRKIRLAVAYQDRRWITPKWKFRQVVRDCYRQEWPNQFNKAMFEEIKKL